MSVCARGGGGDEQGGAGSSLSFLFLLCFELTDAAGESLRAWD